MVLLLGINEHLAYTAREINCSAQSLKLCPDFQRCGMPAASVPCNCVGLRCFENQGMTIK